MLAVLLVKNSRVKEGEVQQDKGVKKKVICFEEWMYLLPAGWMITNKYDTMKLSLPPPIHTHKHTITNPIIYIFAGDF